MRGRITKGIGGFYYVYSYEDSNMYECRAKGVFRKEKIKPVVGDIVEFEITHTEDFEGNITKIYPRESFLFRPLISNISQVIIVVSIDNPKPNLYLIDRYITFLESNNIKFIIVINKIDLDSSDRASDIINIYEQIGYDVFCVSVVKNQGIDFLKKYISNNITALCGGSGVGKSSITNALQSEVNMETGDISKKLGRGRHTTRHSELIKISDNSFIIDTPGFTNIDLSNISEDEIDDLFIEFKNYSKLCKFTNCTHTSEDGCKVKEAVNNGHIMRSRLESYNKIRDEVKNRRMY